MWIIYGLLSALFAAAVAIVGKLGLKTLDSTLATTIRALIMAGFLLVVSFLLRKFRGFSLADLSHRDWLLIVISGIFGAMSWLFYFLALKQGPATPVVALDRLSLAFVFLLGILFLGESFSLKSFFGAAIMVAGAVLLAWK